MILHTVILLWSFHGVYSQGLGSPFGPVYPITAALFYDRYTAVEWDEALSEFSKTGGDTVWLKGAPLILRTKQEFVSDPVFRLCQDQGGSSCIDEAESDLGKLGIKIASFVTYQYDEDFSDDILRCSSQGYDKRIVTKNNTFIRLVLPANKTR